MNYVAWSCRRSEAVLVGTCVPPKLGCRRQSKLKALLADRRVTYKTLIGRQFATLRVKPDLMVFLKANSRSEVQGDGQTVRF
jgi:hypothetical protein